MGCFSFICKECEKAVLSNSFAGDKVKLFLLKDGKVIQEMEGQYDSYGRVFKEGTQCADVKHELMESENWNDPFPEKELSNYEQEEKDKGDKDWAWHRVCDLMFSRSSADGIAAVHSKCFMEVPTSRSEDDPNQGWGDEGELMGDIDPDRDFE